MLELYTAFISSDHDKFNFNYAFYYLVLLNYRGKNCNSDYRKINVD